MSVGNNSICYEAIQRIYRNALVRFLRERMTRVFPGNHEHMLKQPFKKDWEKLVKNASESRDSGGTLTTIRDAYDLLGVNHFFALFDKYYDKLFSEAAGHPPKRPKPSKPKLLGNLKVIKDFRDPLSHPVEEEVGYDEAYGLLVDAQQILSSLGLTKDQKRIAELAEKLVRDEEPEGEASIVDLPSQDSICWEFVGREKLLEELSVYYSDLSKKRCLLAGDGGKGKSAVAYRFAQDVSKRSEAFDMVIWVSAKRRRFQEGRTTRVESPDFEDLESAVNRLLIAYGCEQDLSKPLAEKRDQLLYLLNEFPAFLVVDDIDSVFEDESVVNFFTFDVPRTKSAVLLTSRRSVPGIRTFLVAGFNPDEAEQFVRSRIRLYDLDPAAFTAAIVRDLVKVTDGSPLYMDDLMRLTRVVEVPKAIRLWAAKKGDEARRYALQRELEQLSDDARKCLIAAAVSDRAISFSELEDVLEFSDERLISALQDLQSLFLLPKPRIVEGEQRFEIASNTRKLVQDVESASDLYGRIETRSKALAGRLPRVGRGVIAALIRQAYLLVTRERFQEAERMLLEAVEKYPNAGDLHGFLGFVYRRWERTTDARSAFEFAYKLKCENRDTYLHWVKMEMAEKEWTKAAKAAEKGLRRVPDCYELANLRTYSLLRAGWDLAARLQREKAEKLWITAVGELKERLRAPETLRTGERQMSAQMYQTLIICLDLLGQTTELRYYFRQWQAEHPDDRNVEIQRNKICRKRGVRFFGGI